MSNGEELKSSLWLRMNNVKQWKDRLLWLWVVMAWAGCQSNATEELAPPKDQLVFVYMVADNNLDYFAVQDLNEMERGMPENSRDKLLVYVDRSPAGTPSHPYLMEIKHDTTREVVSPILLSYAERNSASAQTFQAALKDALQYYPNKRFASRGLVLWSHGNAWLPEGVSILTNRDKRLDHPTKSFGLDRTPATSNMDIQALAQALKPYPLDFLLFDACFMASIEVLYELRHAADYIIASPTEILSTGFPYQKVVPLFFEARLNAKAIAQKYFEYYQSKKGLLKSGAISVVKMNEVAPLVRQIQHFASAFQTKSAQPPLALHGILQLDRFDGQWIYDLQDFLAQAAKQKGLTEAYRKILTQWHKTVVYENHTAFMVEKVNLARCHGISTYLPLATHEKAVNDYYKRLPWFKASGYDQMFPNF